jgi:hypothetical protein
MALQMPWPFALQMEFVFSQFKMKTVRKTYMAWCKTVDKNENLRFYIIKAGRTRLWADGRRSAAGAARKKEEL